MKSHYVIGKLLALVITTTACVSLAVLCANAEEQILSKYPPLKLRTIAKVVDDASSNAGFYVFDLNCALGRCSLKFTSLGHCRMTTFGEIGFEPEIQVWTTWSGSLKILEQSASRIKTRIFQGTDRSFPAEVTFEFKSPGRERTSVTAFSGDGFLDLTAVDPFARTFRYVPASRNDTLANFACPIFVPGAKEIDR